MFASSISSENDKAHLGRLNLRGAWSAAVNDLNQYLRIDLGEDFTVTGIATQGSSDKATWVTKYTLKYRRASDWPSFYTEIIQGQERTKVNSLSVYLSIIMIIYMELTKMVFHYCQYIRHNMQGVTIQLGSMTSLMHTCYGRRWNFFLLSFQCWPQNWTN